MNTNAKTTNKGGISDADLNQLKKEYPGLRCGSIEDLSKRVKQKAGEQKLPNTHRLFFYFTVPNKSEWSHALSLMADKDVAGAQTAFYSMCCKWNQPELVEGPYKDENVFAVGKFIGSTFEVADGQEEDF